MGRFGKGDRVVGGRGRSKCLIGTMKKEADQGGGGGDYRGKVGLGWGRGSRWLDRCHVCLRSRHLTLRMTINKYFMPQH